MKTEKKIILSGGWGYGNLGDQAILMSSIKLINDTLPNSQIVILTYDINEIKNFIFPNEVNIEVHNSIHSLIFNRKVEYKNYSHKLDIIEKLKSKIFKKIDNVIKNASERIIINRVNDPELFLSSYKNERKLVEQLFQGADMYIMSGGHYINEWTESLVSKYLEVYLCNKMNIPCYSIGQTIGPFLDKRKESLAIKIAKMYKGIFYRDAYSVKDTQGWGISCLPKAIPDIALYESTCPSEGEQIAFIPFLADLVKNLDKISDNLIKIANDTNSTILIVVSQLWGAPINISLKFYFHLLNRGVKIRFCVPSSYKELQKEITRCKCVISENLHGLILAYRSNIPIICLNNKRKFITFMQQIDREDAIITPGQIKNNELYDMFLKHKYDMSDYRSQFRDLIKESFVSTIHEIK